MMLGLLFINEIKAFGLDHAIDEGTGEASTATSIC